jgi:hypothetical protein
MTWQKSSVNYPLTKFLNSIRGGEWIWLAKRLSGNDTQLTGGHQAGPYIPKSFIMDRFPGLKRNELNPRAELPVTVISHNAPETIVKVIWYNNKIQGDGTRDECRLTNWGGQESPLLDPENTGALCLFAFHQPKHSQNSEFCQVWLCKDSHQEDFIEAEIGEVSPGNYVIRNSEQVAPARDTCAFDETEIPNEWKIALPTGEELVRKCIEFRPEFRKLDADTRLLRRRDCEYEMFLSLERILVLPKIKAGFATVDEFIALANSVANTRKSRSGKSLELHAMQIFQEEGLTEFAHNEITEGKKRPDFIFPSQQAYLDKSFAPEKLTMLGVKTTCKDRWRQILSEADRIPTKHLLTLQQGVSENQFAEMKSAGVILVVPKRLHESFPEKIRPQLMDLSGFIRSRISST